MSSKLTISDDGTRRYYNGRNELHREDGPAIEKPDGTKEYWHNGTVNRNDGPAVEGSDGTKEYWRYGQLHREDGPALEKSNGTNHYYLEGLPVEPSELPGLRSPEAVEADASAAPEKPSTEPAPQPTASPGPASSLSNEQVRDAAQRLTALRPQIEAKDPALAKEIWALDGAVSWEAKSAQDPHIQTRLAYALEDTEKLTGKIDLPQPVREELTWLAGTSPALDNKQLEGLLRQTASLYDPALVKDLRDKAAEIAKADAGGENPAQQAINATKVQNEIHALGYRVATAERINPAAELPRNPSPQAAAASPPAQNPATANQADKTQTAKSGARASAEAQMAALESSPLQARDGNVPSPAPGNQGNPSENRADKTHTTKAQTDASNSSPAQARDEKPSARTPENHGNPSGNARSEKTPSSTPDAKEGAANSRSKDQPEQQPNTNPEEEPAGTPQQVTVVDTRYKIRPVFGGPFANLHRNVTAAIKQATPEAPSQPSQAASQSGTSAAASQNTTASKPTTTLGSRLPSYEQNRRQPERDNEAIQSAHKAAEGALGAMNDFRDTKGAALLEKINDAAKSAEGGLPEVLSGMKAGGAYADLRKEFNALYNQNATFRETYDKASQALADYGEARSAADSAIQNHPQNALAGKLKALDEQIAKASEGVPGHKDGQSITDRLAEKAREIVDAILEKLRNTFDRTNEPSPSPSPSPSP